VVVELLDRAAVEHHAAAIRAIEPGDKVEQRRFADTRVAHDRDELTRGKREIELREHDAAGAVPFVQATAFESGNDGIVTKRHAEGPKNGLAATGPSMKSVCLAARIFAAIRATAGLRCKEYGGFVTGVADGYRVPVPTRIERFSAWLGAKFKEPHKFFLLVITQNFSIRRRLAHVRRRDAARTIPVTLTLKKANA